MKKRVIIYVCPKPDCGNYYASSSLETPLALQQNRRSAMRNRAGEDPSEWGGVTGTRDECPDCRDAGRGVVHRERAAVVVEVPLPPGERGCGLVA